MVKAPLVSSRYSNRLGEGGGGMQYGHPTPLPPPPTLHGGVLHP